MLFRIFLKSASAALKVVGENYHYLTRVLRLDIADKFEIVSGTAEVKVYKISRIDKDNLFAEQIEKYVEDNEPEIMLTIVQALPKADKLEYLLQKCTELGVGEFSLYPADKSPVKVSINSGKLLRWQRIIEMAVCQSRRNRLPEVKIYPALAEALNSCRGKIFYADQTAERKLQKDSLGKAPAVVIGPESGYSPAEKSLLADKAENFNLGKRILRTETAAIAVSAVLLL